LVAGTGSSAGAAGAAGTYGVAAGAGGKPPGSPTFDRPDFEGLVV
jgi:hypothetical protein